MARNKPSSKRRPMKSRKAGKKNQKRIDQNHAILKTL